MNSVRFVPNTICFEGHDKDPRYCVQISIAPVLFRLSLTASGSRQDPHGGVYRTLLTIPIETSSVPAVRELSQHRNLTALSAFNEL